MRFRTLVYQTLGVDTVFFSAPVERPVLPGKSARCGFCEAAWDPGAGQLVEPLMWTQCGQIAGMDPDGGYLCAKHMRYWYCGVCGCQLPEFHGQDLACERCDAQMDADMDWDMDWDMDEDA